MRSKNLGEVSTHSNRQLTKQDKNNYLKEVTNIQGDRERENLFLIDN